MQISLGLLQPLAEVLLPVLRLSPLQNSDSKTLKINVNRVLLLSFTPDMKTVVSKSSATKKAEQRSAVLKVPVSNVT